MANLATVEPTLKPSGFNFENCFRNTVLEKTGCTFPGVVKTGTTIVASLFKDGVVVGADSRATEDNIIADKACMKVHKLTDSIYACGAGTAADLDQVCKMLSSNLQLMELSTGRKARVVACLRIAKQHLFKHQGHVGAYLIIGGVDHYGPHLYEVHAHGSSSTLPYSADGSGSLAAMGILETRYKPEMTEKEALKLVQDAIEAGMHGDLASGNSLNLCVIRKEGTEFKRFIVPDFCKADPRDLKYTFPKDATKVLRTKEVKFEVVEAMEIAS